MIAFAGWLTSVRYVVLGFFYIYYVLYDPLEVKGDFPALSKVALPTL